jgi:PAS domain S-box-containing protein
MIPQFSLFAIPLIISALFAISLAVIGWRCRDSPISRPYTFLMMAAALWTVGYTLQILTADLPSNLFFNSLEYVGIATIPVGWLLIALYYTGREEYVTLRTLALLFVVPAIIVILTATDGIYHFYYAGYTPVTSGGAVIWILNHGTGYWIDFVYTYILIILAFGMILNHLLSPSHMYRRQTLVLLAGCLVPVIFNLIFVFKLNPWPELDLTPFSFAIAGAIVAIGVLRYQLFSSAPIAYSTVFDHITDGVIVMNTQGSVVDLNPAAGQITGFSRAEAAGFPIAIVFPPYLSGSGEPGTEPGTHREIPDLHNGIPFTYDVTDLPITTGSVQRGRLLIIRDISERKQAVTALERANRKLNTLSSITRHDINNKLTAMMTYLDLARDSADPPAIGQYLRQAEEGARGIGDLVKFTKYYQDIGIQSPQWQDVKATIRSAATSVQKGSAAVHSDIGNIEIYADPLLERVFYNLIENAVRYGGEITRITFSAQESPQGLILTCEDDGTGIPDGEKENIFNQKFFKNTGYGLFLTREILSITGLTIRETGGVGEGARFEILIPPGAYRFRYGSSKPEF